MWKCNRKTWQQLDHDARMMRRAGAYQNDALGVLECRAQMGVVVLAVYGTTSYEHDDQCDFSIRTLGSDVAIDERKEHADRIRHYNRAGVSFAERYATRLP